LGVSVQGTGQLIEVLSPVAGPVVFDHPPMLGAGIPQGYLTFTTAAGATVYVPCWAP
jgi:hypothetical protein